MKLPPFENKTIRSVRRTLLSNNMLRSRDAVLVGVSGGPDSMALLHILNTLATEFSMDLGAVHLNHCLREDASEGDAAFVASVAHKLNLPIYMEKVDVLKYGREKCLSVEEAGREIRYTFFNKVADTHGYDRIALGHHSDDNAELVLMFLLRGSGPLGISGIPPVRDGRIIRPLIDLTRSEIMEYLAARNISFVSDRSNTEDRYLRNRIRHQLIPALKASYNPNAVETINRLSRIVRDEDQWADEIMGRILENAVLAKGEGYLILAVELFQGLHIAAKRRLIRKAIAQIKGDLRRITFSHIEAVVDLLNAETAQRTLFLHLPQQVLVQWNRGKLTISREKASLRSLEQKTGRQAIPDFEYIVAGPGSIFIEEIDARMSFSETGVENVPTPYPPGKRVAFFDIHTLTYPLTLRNFRPGDRFQPLGMSGSQKVKKFFIDKKIDRRQRAAIPVLLSRGKIIWIAGHRMAETVKIRAETTKVLKAELFLA